MIFHDSQDSFFRAPRGARPCGSNVVIRLRVSPTPAKVIFRAWWNGEERAFLMAQVSPDVFELVLPLPAHPGVFWYYFIVEREGERIFYGNAPDELGGQGAEYLSEPPSYQITLYDPGFDTPRWMREGIMMQIMVDRFRRSKPKELCAAPPGGVLHADWHEPPALNLTSGGDNQANDFFGGDLKGIEQSLNYLQSLGVGVLYLNPVFEARSNHKYDTGDYHRIDPSFGTEADFVSLCRAAKKRGMRVMLDGVFSHTGADSRYFNKYARYDSLGAVQSLESPYAPWYAFQRWPDAYDCWWGFDTLPNVREMEPSYQDFVIHAEDSVAAHWHRAGASGWRLDVADELPMPFLRMFYRRVKQLSPDGAVLGEVWEDVSRKVTHGELRSYCLGDAMDSCMNYPLRDALIAFMMGEADSVALARPIASLEENYPAPFFYSLMNLLGSHDKPRIINRLSGAGDMEPPRSERRPLRLTNEQYALGAKRYLAAWRFLLALPGMPCIYYGDEAGAQGMADPYCRGTYPWGREDQTLLTLIREANAVRSGSDVLKTGAMRLYAPHPDVCVCVRSISDGRDVFGREKPDGVFIAAINRSDKPVRIDSPIEADLPGCTTTYFDLIQT